MTPSLFFGLTIAGGIGAAIRLVVDGAVRARFGGWLPWGTLVINVSGSLLLGFLTGLNRVGSFSQQWELILGVGLLGGYTTFSAASFETVRLIQAHRHGAALMNGLGMLVLCVAAAFGGYEAGLAL